MAKLGLISSYWEWDNRPLYGRYCGYRAIIRLWFHICNIKGLKARGQNLWLSQVPRSGAWTIYDLDRVNSFCRVLLWEVCRLCLRLDLLNLHIFWKPTKFPFIWHIKRQCSLRIDWVFLKTKLSQFRWTTRYNEKLPKNSVIIYIHSV